MDEPLPTPREALERMLATGGIMQIIVDNTHADVRLPKTLADQATVALNLGYNMPVPMRDFVLGETAVEMVLTFNRNPFRCVVPWTAIAAMNVSVGDRFWYIGWGGPAQDTKEPSAKRPSPLTLVKS